MLKFFFALVVLVAFAWFGTTVPLGPRTLFGHLQAISHTKESQELVEGTKQSAKPLVDDVRRRIAGSPDSEGDPKGDSKAKTAERGAEPGAPAGAATPDAGPPQEKISSTDRHKLRKLLGSAEHTASRH
ncbi:MAG: hypothetical protein QOI66_629 [Myxococcales bacterium]|jgi:hypothetical protein|nr:hypothetical protein [Myxococcales bacterium]